MGQLEERDDGSYVKREFEAPKTQVMGIVINGVLKGDLNWSMIGIGAMIAFMLELCGVSALAFAVGVYVPIQYSSPIFLGGIVRYLVDSYLARQAHFEARANLDRALAEAGDDLSVRTQVEAEAKAQAEIDAIRKAETSGGVLLASGLIAGGSLAGVLLGFLAFNDDWPDDLRQWEHRKAKIIQSTPFKQAVDQEAREFLQEGTTGESTRKQERVTELANQIAKLSENEPYLWVTVPAGTTLKLPEGKGDFTARNDMRLREVAAQELGRERKARKIFEKNTDKLKLPEALPAGAELTFPGRDWPAWLGFGLLASFLLFVGRGQVLGPRPERELVSPNDVPPDGD